MFIKSLHLKNILSFRDTKLDLQPLNVLIGPNGSGKSNLIDVIGLLQAIPRDLPAYFRRSGPIDDWVWRGPIAERGVLGIPAEIEAILEEYEGVEPLRYNLLLSVRIGLSRYVVAAESLRDLGQIEPTSYLAMEGGQGHITDGYTTDPSGQLKYATLTRDHVRPGRSVLEEIRDSFNYLELAETARRFSGIKIYRNWYVGRDSPIRHPQRTDGDPNFLEEDFSNLALVVNDLQSKRLPTSLDSYLKRFYESYESLHSRVYGNTIELVVNESGMSSALPASRLSDGTIRFIALLAILCHPEPPPLICIEEPEIAMHPDSQDLVVQLLKQASERTQLIVTTHSPWLIDRLSAMPEQVVVCERDRHPDKGTQFKRFTREDLEDWLEDQTLGEVWMAGAMGGVH